MHSIKIHEKSVTGSGENLCFTGLMQQLMIKTESVEKERDRGNEEMLVSN